MDLVPFVKPDFTKMPKKASKALTRADRLALLAYSQKYNMTEAGLYWAELRGIKIAVSTAEPIMSRKISEIRKKLEELGHPEVFWEALGLDAMTIARAYGEGMRATMVKPMVVREQKVVQMTNAQGTVYDKVIETEAIQDAGPYVDHQNRIKAADSAARLRGDIKKGESTTVTAGVQGEGFKFLFVVEKS